MIFIHGVNWQAFVPSFQKLKVESGAQELAIQSIENKGDGTIVIRINIPREFNKAEIHNNFIHNYELSLQILQEKYLAELKAKDEQIQIYRHQSADLKEIIKVMASKPMNNDIYITNTVDSPPISEEGTFNIDQSNYSIGFGDA
ncbi:MAG: hypothetical protein F6J94_18860 [Moorea sp. SIO1F2]|uniref:hypothetical protein n=1 Tax=Moorena sp. SIO1F2 TaxID=2607819 RepID=UPI0013B7CBC2|nr:hypothetical protein [Moorena sp. SIO1F2]NET83904.1 hypothetical protein [Moorena sp. SIO1F2]